MVNKEGCSSDHWLERGQGERVVTRVAILVDVVVLLVIVEAGKKTTTIKVVKIGILRRIVEGR